MTKTEYKNELKEIRERLEKLEAAKIEEPQAKSWKPKYRDTYYLVDYAGHVYNTTWDNANVDEWYYLTGNYFKTEEEAEEYKKQIEYTARYKKYIEEHSKPIDWNNGNQPKCCAEFCYDKGDIFVEYYYSHRTQGAIYASTERIILDAIHEIGEENFKKYVLGVK